MKTGFFLSGRGLSKRDFVAIDVVVNDDAVVGFNTEDFKAVFFSFFNAPHCL